MYLSTHVLNAEFKKNKRSSIFSCQRRIKDSFWPHWPSKKSVCPKARNNCLSYITFCRFKSLILQCKYLMFQSVFYNKSIFCQFLSWMLLQCLFLICNKKKLPLKRSSKCQRIFIYFHFYRISTASKPRARTHAINWNKVFSLVVAVVVHVVVVPSTRAAAAAVSVRTHFVCFPLCFVLFYSKVHLGSKYL